MPKLKLPRKASGAPAGFQNWRTLHTIFKEGWIGIKLNLRLWVETCRKQPGETGLPGSSAPLPLILLCGLRAPPSGHPAPPQRVGKPQTARPPQGWRGSSGNPPGSVGSWTLQGGASSLPPPPRLARRGPQETSPGVVAAPRPMSVRGAAMEPGAAESARDPPPVWPRALGAGEGGDRVVVPGAGHGSAAGSHWFRELHPTLQPSLCLEVW